MASFPDPIKSSSFVPLPLSRIPTRSHLEKVTDAVYQHSFKIAQRETAYFPQITSNFTGQNFVCLSSTYLTLTTGSKTDSSIDIEIFRAKTGHHQQPIVIFSHGYGSHPIEYRPLLGELASHGYTVLSLHHLSSSKEIPSLTRAEESARIKKLSYVMANNIQYVLDELRNGALTDIGDADKILLAGHSLGGAVSIMVSRTDPAIAGCVNLDGFLQGKGKTDRLEQPLLMIIGDYQRSVEESAQHPEKEVRDDAEFMSQSLEEYETLRRNSPHSEKIMIERGVHMDFTDAPFNDYLAGEKALDAAMRVHTIVSQKMLTFMHSIWDAR